MLDSLVRNISEFFLPHPPALLGVAVSGGSDSMALLQLLHETSKVDQFEIHAVTVDHRLRPEAADEAAYVAKYCASLGIQHDTLVWENWDRRGNLQQAARDVRYTKISNWADLKGIDTVALGHTADDQAETVLMRLSRRSGVDGLTGMQSRVLRHGVNWVRPLLHIRREVLRSYLTRGGIKWHDDPSNEDMSYDRIKIRKAMKLLEPLGIDVEGLNEVAGHMAEVRTALEWNSFLAAKDLVTVKAGSIVLCEQRLHALPDEIQRRLLRKAISWVSGSDHGPRRDAMINIMAGLRKGRAGTADGCHVRRIADSVWVFRELQAVSSTKSKPNEYWDGRWSLTPTPESLAESDLQIRALDMDGIEQCPDWRLAGVPHVVLLSSPSVWRGDVLVAAPLAGYAQNWHAETAESGDDFFAALLTH